MKKYARMFALLSVVSAATPALSHAQTLVPAGKMFANAFLDVRAPLTGDWMIAKSSQAELAFARAGDALNESFIAQVSLFALPDFKGKDEFEALVKQGVQADSPTERFKPVSADFEYTEQRGYPCVKYVGVTEDMKAKTSTSATETVKLMLQFNSLYCQHPTVPGVGFMVGMSHRGDAVIEDLAKDAEVFIAGVQVAKRTAKPVVQTEAPAGMQPEVIPQTQPEVQPAAPAEEVEEEVRG
ncbi:hypothetical protein [Herminiimonas sp. KBW02]|uniref:hypothetical protein n=1 Tax=Herminiimonas sp. KBW02 TaxID=2153363 RepID=UPI000F5A9257|nr:hypothetical protein [Herminiimonas sp. KBW02]